MKKILINAVLGAAVLGWLVFSDESVGKQAEKDAATFNSFKR